MATSQRLIDLGQTSKDAPLASAGNTASCFVLLRTVE